MSARLERDLDALALFVAGEALPTRREAEQALSRLRAAFAAAGLTGATQRSGEDRARDKAAMRQVHFNGLEGLLPGGCAPPVLVGTAAGAAPEGFVLVPTQITPEMAQAFANAPAHENGHEELQIAWTAMLAAAQQPGAQHGQEGR